MTGIISTLAATTLESGKSPVNLTADSTIALYWERTNPPRVSGEAAIALYTDRSYPVRVTYFTGYALMTIRESPVVDIPQPALPQRELNPYRPTTPDEIEDVNRVLYDFIREQTATIRAQHNLTQAGDSTFPWELLTKVGPEKQFTLGSIGRFYHDDHGLILARYVQFGVMNPGPWVHGPVGRLKDSDRIDWVVTNDPELSGPDLVVGILGSLVTPEAGNYGWVLTQGANIFPLASPVDEVIASESKLVWSGFETVSAKGKGVVLGTCLDSPIAASRSQAYFPIGSVFLGLEGPSIESLAALLGDQFDDMREDIKEVSGILDSLGGTKLADRLDALEQSIESQGGQLDKIQSNQDLADIKRRLRVVEQNSGEELLNRIQDSVSQQNDDLIRQVRDIRDSLQPFVMVSGRLDELERQFRLIQDAFNTTIQNAEAVYYPLVDGGIPPQLVYLPTGELVLVKDRI